jgi:DNA-binding HxlR family transcriptional regulator
MAIEAFANHPERFECRLTGKGRDLQRRRFAERRAA